MTNINKAFELAKEDWMNIDLGDKRLNERAVKIAHSFLENPFVSPPKMMQSLGATKAFYRFIDSDKVTRKELITPHINKLKENLSSRGLILCIHDSTTITLNRNYDIDSLYKIGGNNGNSLGIIVHNTISVKPYKDFGLIDGLLYQNILLRKPKGKQDCDNNETKLWTDAINTLGHPPKEKVCVDVMDRGADIIEVMNSSIDNGREFIIRAKHNRWLDKKKSERLFTKARQLPSIGETYLEIQGNNKRKKRTARLEISFCNVTLPTTVSSKDLKPVNCNMVRICERDCPDNQEPLEWIILTSLEVKNFEDALRIVKFYSYRWIIEEYHKCMKTGFRLEDTQLKTLRRIENLLGLISVSAVKLLQIRDIVKQEPQSDAIKYVNQEDVTIIQAYYQKKKESITIDQFIKYIAQMGGFLNRKSDGNPGWQSIWAGWKFFLALKKGVRLSNEGLIYG